MVDLIAPHEVPLLEYDPSTRAVIDPRAFDYGEALPRHAVLCFFGDRVEDLAARGVLTRVGEIGTEMRPLPIYLLAHQGQSVVVMQPGVGAPLAAGVLEELWGRGCDCFVVCGGCGVLDRAITVGHLLVPTQALRDEGTSYHYLPAARWVEPTPRALQAVCDELEARGLPYLRCKAWTTDAFYRETPAKVALRRDGDGCLAVEMEAAALFAVARFRGIELAQVLYAGDDVSGHEWDSRAWNGRHDLREELIYVAADAVLRLTK
jgi:uridine phosphorylase